MAVTLNPTNITFNDGTVQTTAAGGAPGFNTVGSYCMLYTTSNLTSGSNYGAGTVISGIFSTDGTNLTIDGVSNISGTWKWMSASGGSLSVKYGMGVRVS